MSEIKNESREYRYSFGRKAFFTSLGLGVLFLSLVVASRLNIDPKLYKAFILGVIGLITGFGFQNAGISIASLVNKKKNGG